MRMQGTPESNLACLVPIWLDAMWSIHAMTLDINQIDFTDT